MLCRGECRAIGKQCRGGKGGQGGSGASSPGAYRKGFVKYWWRMLGNGQVTVSCERRARDAKRDEVCVWGVEDG